MKTVLVTDIAWPDLRVERELLDRVGLVPRLAPSTSEAVGILTCWAPVDADLIGSLPHLRAISRYGVGLDNIDVSAATARGIPVVRVASYCTDEVRSHTVGLALTLLRRIPEYADRARGGAWGIDPNLPVRRIRDLRAAVIGRGEIGRAVADTFAALGMQVVDQPDDADVLSLHIPMTPANARLVDRAYLARLAPGAVVVNTSRGGVLDPTALLGALLSGHVRAAGLDVLDHEPPPAEDALLRHPNVLVTPHMAFYSTESLIDLRRRATENLVQALRERDVL